MRYFIGAFVVFIGCLLILKTEWFLENFGPIGWAEANLGTSGGSRLMYKLIGLLGIFVGFLLITNMFQGFIMGTLGKVFLR